MRKIEQNFNPFGVGNESWLCMVSNGELQFDSHSKPMCSHRFASTPTTITKLHDEHHITDPPGPNTFGAKSN
jgi:hypothetical protein